MPTSHSQPRRAFTLVELMVVLVIIAILGSVIMFAMFNAQNAAREAKTKNMITKLNELIMRRYESYMTRRVPIRDLAGTSNANMLAYNRLQALRELMRLEMPDRWTDVRDDPVTGIQRPAVNRTYFRKVTAAGRLDSDTLQGAECLYMIVAFGLEDADALSKFSQTDVGDTDNDGLLEFLDGWGQPISYIRWPAGFESPRQSRDENRDFDQFNPRRVQDRPSGAQPSPPSGMPRRFALYPLIYSGGVDQKKDILTGGVDASGNAVPLHYSVRATGGVPAYVDPYIAVDTQGTQVGLPADTDGDGALEHGNNIHNHNLTIR